MPERRNIDFLDLKFTFLLTVVVSDEYRRYGSVVRGHRYEAFGKHTDAFVVLIFMR
jgi:hypothetical protein